MGCGIMLTRPGARTSRLNMNTNSDEEQNASNFICIYTSRIKNR